MSNNLLTTFNDHLMEFIDDILRVFPNSVDVLATHKTISAIRKMNPKLIIKIWKKYIADKYMTQIENNDISFFVEKDYFEDLTNMGNSEQIVQSIDKLRDPIKQMTKEDQSKSMKYMYNLSKISVLYNSQV
jgi:hypothetical protein